MPNNGLHTINGPLALQNVSLSLPGTVSGGGTDFASIAYYENFTGGTNGNNISTVSSLSSTNNTTIADDPKGTHGKVASDSILTAQTNAFSDGFVYTLPTALGRYDEAWARLKVLMPTDFSYTANPWFKFMRWHVDGAAGHASAHIGYDDWYIEPDGDHRFIFEGENSWNVLTTDQSKAPTLDAWQDWEMHIVFDTSPVDSGGQARVDFWRDGTLLGSVTNRRTLNNATDVVSEFHFMSFWNGGPPANQTLYYTKFAYAFKKSGVRDDSVHLSTDGGGRKFIGISDSSSPLYTETWEGLANGAGIAGRGNAEVTWNATSANVRASTDRGYGGSSVSLKAAWPAGVQPGTNMPFSLATEVPTIYVGFRLFVPSNFYNTNTSNTGGGSVNKKFFAVWNGTDGYSGYNDCILEYTPDGSGNGLLDPTFQDETSLAQHLQGYLTTNGLMPSTPLIDTATDLNRWVTFCIQVTRATSASGTGVSRRGNGILRIWKDGALYFQMLDYPNFTTGSKGYDDGYLIGAANGGFAVDTNLYVDDVVFGTEYGAMTGYVP